MPHILSTKKQKEIMKLKKRKTGRNEIARRLNLSPNTVSYYMKRRNIKVKRVNEKKLGRKTIITKAMILKMKRKMKDKPYRSAGAIAGELGLKCCPSTARNLLKRANATYKKRQLKPPLSQETKKARVNFAEIHLRDDEKWKRTIFADEKKFNLDGPDNSRMTWILPSQSPRVEHQSHFHRQSIMIWGAVGYGYKSPLVFIQNTMNADAYVHILDTILIPTAHKVYRSHWRLIHDNSPIHTAIMTQNFIFRRYLDVLAIPPYSPDLNIIENVWSLLTSRVFSDGIPKKTVAELREAIIQAWDQIEMTQIHACIDSMYNRMHDIQFSMGEHTKY